MITGSVVVKKNVVRSKIRAVKTRVFGAADRAADTVLSTAQARVPRGAQHQDGISIYESLTKRPVREGIYEVGAVGAHGGRPVSVWVETGTVKTHAHPYLRPAATAGRRQLKEEASAQIRAEANAD